MRLRSRYSVNGKQYVAVLVGSRQPLNVWNYAPELKHTSTASMLYVFGSNRLAAQYAGAAMLAPAISPQQKDDFVLCQHEDAHDCNRHRPRGARSRCSIGTGRRYRREDARAIERGKEIYKVKANCQFCHKWDASGDQGYGGNASSLRKTFLTPEQFAEVVKCGRPSTGMPYHDQFAYTDKRCFGVTSARPRQGHAADRRAAQRREIDAVVKYLFAKVVGRGASTYEDCVDFWGQDTRQCEPMKK